MLNSMRASKNSALSLHTSALVSAFRHHTSDIARMNMDMVVNILRPQLEVTKEEIEPVIILGLYHHRDLIGSPSAFIKGKLNG